MTHRGAALLDTAFSNGSRSMSSNTTSEPLLRITSLSKTFGATKALLNVDLDLVSGEVHALVGQNGSGKSTLIKILSGYHRADPGATVLFEGEPWDGSRAGHNAHGARLRFV